MVDRPTKEWLADKTRSLSGGVNNKQFPLDLERDQAVELRNARTDVIGLTEKAPGSSIVASGISFGPILDMQFFSPGISSLPTRLLAVTKGASEGAHRELWEWDGTGDWSNVGTLSGYTGSNSIDIMGGFDLHVDGGDAVIILTADTVTQWWYNGVTLGGAMIGDASPVGSFGDYYQSRAVINGIGDRKNSVYFSDVASFTVTGWASPDLRRWDFDPGGRVTAIKGFRGAELAVFFESRIALLNMTDTYNGAYGDPLETWSKRVVHRQFGCGARRTVVSVGEDLFFMDQYGHIRSLARTINDVSQGVRSVPISDRISAFVDRINPAALQLSSAAAFGNFYVLTVPLDTAALPNAVFVYDITRKAWDGPWDSIRYRSFAGGKFESPDSDSDRRFGLYGAQAGQPIVRRMFDGLVNSGNATQGITYQVTTRKHDFSTLEAEKRWRRVEFLAVGTANDAMSCEASVNGMPYVTLGAATLAGDGLAAQLPKSLPYDITNQSIVSGKFDAEDCLERGIDIQLRFTCHSEEEIKLLGYHIFATIEKSDQEVAEGS